jgi:hypothetical protein
MNKHMSELNVDNFKLRNPNDAVKIDMDRGWMCTSYLSCDDRKIFWILDLLWAKGLTGIWSRIICCGYTTRHQV